MSGRDNSSDAVGKLIATGLFVIGSFLYHQCATTSYNISTGKPLILENAHVTRKYTEDYKVKGRVKHRYYVETDQGLLNDNSSTWDGVAKGEHYDQIDSAGVYNFHYNRDDLTGSKTILSLTAVMGDTAILGRPSYNRYLETEKQNKPRLA